MKIQAPESDRLRLLSEAIQHFNMERDWGQYHSPRNLAMAISVEASELLELFLWSSDDGPQPPVAAREGQVAEEVGDILITLLNFCASVGIDPLEAAEEKLRRNREKYPVAQAKGR